MKHRLERALLLQLRQSLGFRRGTKRAVVMVSDGILSVLSVWLAFSLRIGNWMLDTPQVLFVLGISFMLWPAIFYACGVYRTIFRFAGLRTIGLVARATAYVAGPMILIITVVRVQDVPRTVGVLFPLIFFLLVSISRIVARYLFVEVLHQGEFKGSVKRVLIYGAGFAGQKLASSLHEAPSMWLRGFVDDDLGLSGQRLDNVSIFAAPNLLDVVEQLDIDAILLAIPSLSRSRQKQIIDSLSAHPVQVLMLPNVEQIIDGNVSINDLREVAVEDLLGREPVEPNQLLLSRTIIGKTVLVTGAGGSIGSELCRQILAARPQRLVLVDMTEHALYMIERELRDQLATTGMATKIPMIAELANVADAVAIKRIMLRHRPNTVFHAAAYKHVPLVEHNMIEGLKNNIEGTTNTVAAAELAGVVRFILISTDKAVRPTNIMGASKRVCELVLQARAGYGTKTRFASVRFGNVLGSSGSVVPLFREQIIRGGPVTLTDTQMTRYFMTIPEAAQLVIQAGALAKGGEVYLLDMGSPVRIYDLATTMINLSGLTVRSPSNPDGDIEIREIGLRPGEKLYEELLIGNNPEETIHPRIMRAREQHIGWTALQKSLNLLLKALSEGNEAAALSILRSLVPEYQPMVIEEPKRERA